MLSCIPRRTDISLEDPVALAEASRHLDSDRDIPGPTGGVGPQLGHPRTLLDRCPIICDPDHSPHCLLALALAESPTDVALLFLLAVKVHNANVETKFVMK